MGSLTAISYIIPYQRTQNRWREINGILTDLKTLGNNPEYRSAVRLNIEFFRAIRTPFSYFFWLIFKAPNLRKNREEIVELLDLPFNKWQTSVLETLSWFEVWLRGLEPIKKHIINELHQFKRSGNGPIVLASFGCGGMELERQITYRLLRERFNHPLVFVGVDYSPSCLEVINAKFQNLVSRGLVEIKTMTHLSLEDLEALKTGAKPHTVTLVFLKADAFDLKELPRHSFDLVYHTRLRHHLTPAEREKLDELAVYLSPRVVEMDDVSSIAGIIVISLFLWRFPAVLNGAILSYLRDLSKEELLAAEEPDWNVVFSGRPLRSYLRIYDKAASVPPL